MEKLKKYIGHYFDKKTISTDLSHDEKEELDFLTNFMKSFDINNIYSMMNCNKKDFLLAIISSSDDNKVFSIIKDKIEKLDNNFFSCTNYNDIYDLYNCLIEFVKKGVFYLAESLPLNDDYDENSEIIQEIKDKGLLENSIKLNTLLKKYIHSDEQKRLVLELYLEYSYELVTGLAAIAVLNETSINSNNSVNPNNFDRNVIGFSSKSVLTKNFNCFDRLDLTNKKHLKDVMSLILNAAKVKDKYLTIKDRIDYLKRIPVERERENNRIIRKKEKILSYLDSFDMTKPIQLSNSFLELVENEKLKYFIIVRILKHNLQFQKQTIVEIEKEKELSILEKLFKKSQFSFNSLSEEQRKNLINFGNVENIEKILILFTDSDISFGENFPIYDILLLGKPSSISDILKMINANIISYSFADRNPSIFIEKIDELLKDKTIIKEAKNSTLIDNINQLKGSKINISSLSKRGDEILLMNTDELVSSISLLQQYSLDYESSNNYELIKNKKLIAIADRFIELGLADYIITHPYLIAQRSFTRLKRMELCRMFDIPLLIDGKINSRITSNEFKIGKNVLNDDDLDLYLTNSVSRYQDDLCYKIISECNDYSCDLKEINAIEKYRVSELEYSFNGIIISANKVLRNYTILSNSKLDLPDEKILFNSIIYGSMLDDEKLDTISNLLNEEKEKKLINC